MTKCQYLLTTVLFTISLSANAEVTLDGTLGSSNHLPGPDYLFRTKEILEFLHQFSPLS